MKNSNDEKSIDAAFKEILGDNALKNIHHTYQVDKEVVVLMKVTKYLFTQLDITSRMEDEETRKEHVESVIGIALKMLRSEPI